MVKEVKLMVTPSPHLRSAGTVSEAMRDVIIALIPVSLVSIYWFRFYAVTLILVCLVTAALTELGFRRVMRKPSTLNDGSALLTGLLVALCFSATTPWWTAALATFVAVGIAKELMGGLGWNRFNPALFGRVMVIFLGPLFGLINREFAALSLSLGRVDVLTQATPLALMQRGLPLPSYQEMLVAYPGGALGETSAIALLLGGAYLLYRKHISWRIPVSILATVAILTVVLGKDPLYHLLTGGLLLGTFFMATDWVTSPITKKGKVVFGVLIGVLIVVFRVVMAPTEGVAFAILIMNGFVPVIESATRRPFFGAQPTPLYQKLRLFPAANRQVPSKK